MIERLKGGEKVYQYPNKILYLEENCKLLSFIRETLQSQNVCITGLRSPSAQLIYVQTCSEAHICSF